MKNNFAHKRVLYSSHSYEGYLDYGIVLATIVASILVRLYAISSNPAYIGGGDTSEYVAFSRELVNNHFLVPQFNTIHYPGSVWVYPPILMELFAFLIYVFGTSGWTPYYVLAFASIAINSLTIVPLWKTVKFLFNRTSAIIVALIYVVYLPDMYLLSWGALPQVFADFLIAWIIYFLVKNSILRKSSIINVVITGVLLGILSLSHDLSIFVVGFVLLVYLALRWVLNAVHLWKEERSLLRTRTVGIISTMLIGAPFFLYWYIPRLWWVIDSVFPPKFTGGVLRLPLIDALNQNLLDVSQPLGQFFTLYSLFLLAIPLIALSVYALSKKYHKRESALILLSFVLAPLAIMAWKFNEPILFERLAYFVFYPSLVLLGGAIGYLIGLRENGAKGKSLRLGKEIQRYARYVFLILIGSILIQGAYSGAIFNYNAHSYYNHSGYTPAIINSSALSWIHINIESQSVIAAPYPIAYYIMGYDGNPTLMYMGLNYLTQPAEWNESLAAYNVIFEPAKNVNYTVSLIYQYNISYVVIYDSDGVKVPAFYHLEYKNNLIQIYGVQ